MQLDAYDIALDLIRALRGPLAGLARRDSALASQLRRAATSVPLNIREGSGRSGKDRRRFRRIAFGSVEEVKACVEVAEAFGYVEAGDIAPALGLVERELAMLWRLTR